MLSKLLLLALAVASLTFYAGCTSDMGRSESAAERRAWQQRPDYYGPATLEERIAGADAIVRARFLSASASGRAAGRTFRLHRRGGTPVPGCWSICGEAAQGRLVALIDDTVGIPLRQQRESAIARGQQS